MSGKVFSPAHPLKEFSRTAHSLTASPRFLVEPPYWSLPEMAKPHASVLDPKNLIARERRETPGYEPFE